ncbi:MAG TPA: aminotransferase class I/II-fold pyridoxal phosphate-dependent enzyme, partial [Synergistaceae bacterium]|nr:aminotransferase class I/II-fold pyridoxal phosphate-dependent enzyme [Synergistaceae bacterium]
ELNHASIIDGCRLSRAKIVRWDHASPASLRQKLEEYKDQNCRKLVITDGVFSMDGDVAPLPELLKVTEAYDVMLMVDDAHGEGVLGSHGRGIIDHFGLHGKVEVEVGTLSKAFGVVGGFVAGSRELVEYLNQKSRPFLFSSAMTVPDVGANLAAVEILQQSDELVSRLWKNGEVFKKKMASLGFNTGKSDTPITPVIVGEATLARKLSSLLFEKGVFAQAIAFPTVPLDTARIRVMISAAHSQEDLDFAVDAFASAGRELGIIR